MRWCLLLCLGGCGSAVDPAHIKPPVDLASPDTKIDLPATLARLDAAFAAQGISPHSPIGAADLASLAQRLPCALPPTLEAIYRWHDGIPSITPYDDWSPLAEMVKDYEEMRASERELNAREGDLWPRTFLPVIKFDSREYIALDCSKERNGAMFHYFIEEPENRPRYRGLGHFLSVTLAAYETGAYRRRRGDLTQYPLLLANAFKKNALASELAIIDANSREIDTALRTASGMAFQMAVRWATLYPDERQVPVLRDRLKDSDDEVVMSSLFALGEYQVQDAHDEISALLSSSSPQVRNFAALALAKLDRIEPGPTIDGLTALLDDENDLVRLSAIEALEASRSPRAIGPLLHLLPMSRPGIQEAIVSTLGVLADAKALEPLRELRLKVAAMDQSQPDRGGTRGSDPPPQRLLARIDGAIRAIEAAHGD